MRALRFPLIPEVPATGLPAWIIDGDRAPDQERREAPRLELPVWNPDSAPRAPEKDADPAPAPGSTVIVIPL